LLITLVFAAGTAVLAQGLPMRLPGPSQEATRPQPPYYMIVVCNLGARCTPRFVFAGKALPLQLSVPERTPGHEQRSA